MKIKGLEVVVFPAFWWGAVLSQLLVRVVGIRWASIVLLLSLVLALLCNLIASAKEDDLEKAEKAGKTSVEETVNGDEKGQGK